MHGGRTMPQYAVKIGEIHLVSNKPITPEERERAIRGMAKNHGTRRPLEVTEGGLEISIVIG